MNQASVGAEWSPVTDGTVPMSKEARGHAINRRRIAQGINSLREFAEATGLSRQTIARAEEGDPRTTETTFVRLEAFLDKFDYETSSEAEDAAAAGSGSDEQVVEYRLSGDFGVDLIVKGPVSNIAEMEASIGRLLAQMRSKGGQQD